jgi:hypothetical protein
MSDKKQKKQISGLNDFLGELKNSPEKSKNNDPLGEQHDPHIVLRVLEHITHFHRVKAPNAIRNNQSQSLLIKRKEKLKEVQAQAVKKHAGFYSPLHQFISELMSSK